MSAAQFCDNCGVSLDLHDLLDGDEPTPSDCDHADAKASLLERFPFGGIR